MAAGGETCLYRFRFASTGMLILMICTSGPRYHLILFYFCPSFVQQSSELTCHTTVLKSSTNVSHERFFEHPQ